MPSLAFRGMGVGVGVLDPQLLFPDPDPNGEPRSVKFIVAGLSGKALGEDDSGQTPQQCRALAVNPLQHFLFFLCPGRKTTPTY